jgi:hypothetical protein
VRPLSGLVPASYLATYGTAVPLRLCRALCAYEPGGADQRALYESELLWTMDPGLEETADGWLLAADTHTLVPANYVDLVDV